MTLPRRREAGKGCFIVLRAFNEDRDWVRWRGCSRDRLACVASEWEVMLELRDDWKAARDTKGPAGLVTQLQPNRRYS